MPLVIPYTFTAATKAKASEVNANFDAIETLFNVTKIDLAEYGKSGTLALDQISATLQGQLDVGSSRRDYAEVLSSQNTSSTSFTDLSTVGPQVTVTVPAGGLVLVMASVNATNGDVGLYEATDLNPAQQVLSTFTAGGVVYTAPRGDLGTPNGTSQRSGAGALCFPATAGARTYMLKYRVSNGGEGGGGATFSNRKLWVWTLGNF